MKGCTFQDAINNKLFFFWSYYTNWGQQIGRVLEVVETHSRVSL